MSKDKILPLIVATLGFAMVGSFIWITAGGVWYLLYWGIIIALAGISGLVE